MASQNPYSLLYEYVFFISECIMLPCGSESCKQVYAVVTDTEGHFIEYGCICQSIMYETGSCLFLSSSIPDICMPYLKLVIAVLQ